jgi:carbonic anhydrase
MIANDPYYFERLATQQAPAYLWIGCADSRVPATELVDLPPGQMFVHRNVANVVVHSDLNCLAVLHYAVDVLRVRHIIVCGHYGCGGVEAALNNRSFGLIDNWLRHVQDVRNKHLQLLNTSRDDTHRFQRLCELNVIEQVVNVCHTTSSRAHGSAVKRSLFMVSFMEFVMAFCAMLPSRLPTPKKWIHNTTVR